MTNNKRVLKQIYSESKSINRNMQHLADIGLICLLKKSLSEAEEDDNVTGKTLAKAGLFLVAISEIVLLISDIIDFRKKILE